MKLKNHELDKMLDHLLPLLDMVNIVGYAAARNASIIRGLCGEYVVIKENLLMKLGEELTDENGTPTGKIFITPDSEYFEEFENKISKISEIEHEFTPFQIRYEDAIGILSGQQFLMLDWMFIREQE